MITSKFYDQGVIGTVPDADTPLMTPPTLDQHARSTADEPLVVITAEQLEQAQRDPELVAFLERADAYLAELEQQGRSL